MANNTILLIDYEPRSIERFRDPLVAAGFSVEIATDGISGIEAFHRLNPDMVLVEAMIPKKHGFEVCQDLKRTPHGRGTPVIITTGVYKGRKYRTQALHIYGCDEYIEKPIAAAHLLEIVGRFLTLDASGSASGKSEASPSSSGSGSQPIVRTNIDAVAKSGTASARKDDGEDEITARLDAILSGVTGESPAFAAPQSVAVAPAVQADPFAQMKAELDAELGAIPTPMAFETAPSLEPIPESLVSDQLAVPSVLESLPSVGAAPALADPVALDAEPELAPAAMPSVSPAPLAGEEDHAGQLVSFESKRRRKGKKSDKGNAQRSRQKEATAEVESAASIPVTPDPAKISPTLQRESSQESTSEHRSLEIGPPKGSIVESELEIGTGKRAMPAWAWGAVAVVIIAGLYFVYPRGSSEPVESPRPEAAATESTAVEPPPPPAPPEASAPMETLPKASEPAPVVPAVPKPVAVAAKAPATKKKSDPSPTPPVTSQAAPQSAAPVPTRAEPPTLRPAPTVSSAPPSTEANTKGVETVAAPLSSATPTPVERGALVPIDVADTMPVPVNHRAPAYSAAARQLRLSGTVTMNVLVNDRGTVDRVVLVNGVPGADLNDAAMAAAKSWTYTPATKDGVPVKVWRSEQVVFKP